MIRNRSGETSIRRYASIIRGAFLGVVVLGLLSCQVRLVGDYDEHVANGLTSYQRDVTAFLHRMAAAQGDDGNYATNKEFYHKSKAQLESLITRARAMDDGPTCLPAKYVELGIEALKKKVSEVRALVPDTTGSPENTTSTETGSCTVVVLTAVKDNNEILERIHERNRKLSKVVLDIVGPTVEQGVRIALKNELAKKRGGN